MTLLHSTMALLDSTTLYDGSTWLYFTLLHYIIVDLALLVSTTLHLGSTTSCSRAKVECSTVKYSQVEPWQNVVESSIQSRRAMVECSRGIQSQVELW